MSKWRLVAHICGWLSLLCWLPALMFVLAGGRVKFPGWVLVILLRGLFLSPFAGTVLALIAATAQRRWLVLAAIWLAALAYGWSYQSRHPFDM